MNRHRPTALAGLGVALLSNYWLLEWWLSERTDTPRSWISDLATRTEATGWRFQALSVLSGLAIAAFALLLRRHTPCTCRPEGDKCRGCGGLKWGLWALFAVGVFATIAGAAPLSCPEGIEPGCQLAEDPGDVIHALATGGEILATVLAFGLLGLALSPRSGAGGRAAWLTLVIGAAWLALTAATGLSYLSGDVDAVKGILQRASQVLFGTWLALLGWWFARESALGVLYRPPEQAQGQSEAPE